MGEPKDKAKAADKNAGARRPASGGQFLPQRSDGNPPFPKPNDSASGTSVQVLKGVSQTHSAALARLKDR